TSPPSAPTTSRSTRWPRTASSAPWRRCRTPGIRRCCSSSSRSAPRVPPPVSRSACAARPQPTPFSPWCWPGSVSRACRCRPRRSQMSAYPSRGTASTTQPRSPRQPWRPTRPPMPERRPGRPPTPSPPGASPASEPGGTTMTTTSQATTSRGGGARVAVQRFGTFLSGMIIPNIAAFIAWGIITALFIQTGWVPFAPLGGFEDADGVSWPGLVGPMITYLLPLLIAYTGGRMVYNVRGGVIGAVVTMGVIIGAAGTVMFLGAMICGPLAAWILKQVDKIWAGRIRPGFEMLVDNFSSGILGFLLALGAFFGLAPVIKWFSDVLGGAVGWLVDTGLIPLASIIVEPAKVLFLNNAINHGVFTPLGTEQSLEQGKSLLFLVEANPGPGAGLLIALTLFGVGAARATAPGAFIIQFLGGIHEVYFPYVLAKPLLIV